MRQSADKDAQDKAKAKGVEKAMGGGLKFKPSPMKNMAYWGDKNGPASALKASPNKLMGLVKKKVNKELETPAGKMAAKAATGGVAG